MELINSDKKVPLKGIMCAFSLPILSTIYFCIRVCTCITEVRARRTVRCMLFLKTVEFLLRITKSGKFRIANGKNMLRWRCTRGSAGWPVKRRRGERKMLISDSIENPLRRLVYAYIRYIFIRIGSSDEGDDGRLKVASVCRAACGVFQFDSAFPPREFRK